MYSILNIIMLKSSNFCEHSMFSDKLGRDSIENETRDNAINICIK